MNSDIFGITGTVRVQIDLEEAYRLYTQLNELEKAGPPGSPIKKLRSTLRATLTEGGEEMYGAIAEELDGDLTLDEMRPAALLKAELWAKENEMVWPPRPRASGIEMKIY